MSQAVRTEDAETALLLEQRMRIVREGLEGVMDPAVATDALFQALSAVRDLSALHGARGFETFVGGPLKDAVGERIGHVNASSTIDQICDVLKHVPCPERDEKDTLEVPLSEGPVRVLLLAGTAKLGITLRAELGGDKIALAHAEGLDRASRVVADFDPEVIVIDGSGPPHIATPELLDLLRTARGATCVLWASEEPWSHSLVAMPRPTGSAWIALERGGGYAPLVDLIRRGRRVSGVQPRVL